MLASYSFLLLILNFSQLNLAQATPADHASSLSVFDALHHSEIIDVTLSTDLELLRNNQKTNEYQEATLDFETAAGTMQQLTLKVRPRGKFRRRVCDFAPLKLNFSKSDLAKAGYNDFDKMKLVTHCMDDRSISKENIMREYMAYKLYNEITDQSLRVQLVRITYVDTQSKTKIKNRYGFLIEGVRQLAHRMNAEEYEQMNVNDSQLVAGTESTVAFFQYMIGNADWDIKMLRNVKLMSNKASGMITAVPFDFDFSGLVNAPYAIPNPDYKLRSVKQRYYLGHDISQSEWNNTVDLYQRKRVDLINLVLSFKHLKKSSREDMIQYLDEFYSELETKQANKDSLQWSSDQQMLEEGSTLPVNPSSFKK
ncbi:MAG: hypothetical protein AAFO94_16880 [Bacteroidota bacterium]